MKKDIEILIKDHIVQVKNLDDFAIMTRQPDSEGRRKIIFSIPLIASYADIIENSGIASVRSINYDECVIYFSPMSFFETYLMIELISDILLRHENKNAR